MSARAILSLLPSALLLGAMLAGGCGDAPAPPAAAWPSVPAVALVELQAMDDADLQAQRLAAWPLDNPRYRQAEATQTALTWRLQRDLDAGELDAAVQDYERLTARFEGEGRLREGRTLSASTMRGGLVEVALDHAVAQVSGPRPDLEAARATLELARAFAHGLEDLPLDEVTRWVQLEGTRGPLAEALAAGGHEPETRVVVVADLFALRPEGTLMPVLRRWIDEQHQSAGGMATPLVVLAGLRRGFVVRGIRRAAAGPAEVEAALSALAREAGVVQTSPEVALALEAELGLGRTEGALLIVTKARQVAGRLRGAALDARVLEPVWQRLHLR